MAGVEAVRVLSVLEQTVEGLQLLSYITGPVLRAPEQIAALLGPGVAAAAAQYQTVLYGRAGNDDVASEELVKAIQDLWRHLKRVPECESKLRAMHGERAPAMQDTVRLLADIRDFAHKRLTTTVEEDRSVREHFEDVKIREEKAVSEKQQLQQKLKLERLQRQRQCAVMQRSHGAAEAQLTTMRAGHAASVRAMQEQAQAADAAALATFSGRQEELQSAVEAARAQLEGLQSENAEREAAACAAKRKGELDVLQAIAEYDKELAVHTSAVRDERAAVDDLAAKIAALREGLTAMQQERGAREAAEERARREVQRQRLADFVRNRAARIVQMHWKLHQLAVKKAKKAGGKGGKNGKNKK